MSVKYLGVFLNDSLSWDTHLNTLIPKLNRAIHLLPKIRHHTPKYILKTIYFSLFNSHLIYASQIWGQSKSDHFRKLVQLQDKALTIINFLPDTALLIYIYIIYIYIYMYIYIYIYIWFIYIYIYIYIYMIYLFQFIYTS